MSIHVPSAVGRIPFDVFIVAAWSTSRPWYILTEYLRRFSQHTTWITWFYFVQVYVMTVSPVAPRQCAAYARFSLIMVCMINRLPTIVVSHFMLNLRGLYFSDRAGCEGSRTSLHLSDVRFPGFSAADVVGSLSATLMLPTESQEHVHTLPDAPPPLDETQSHIESGHLDGDTDDGMVIHSDFRDIESYPDSSQCCDDPFSAEIRASVTANSLDNL